MDTDIVEIKLTKEELRIFSLGFAGGIALMGLSGDLTPEESQELLKKCESIKTKIQEAMEPKEECLCSIHGTPNCPAHKGVYPSEY